MQTDLSAYESEMGEQRLAVIISGTINACSLSLHLLLANRISLGRLQRAISQHEVSSMLRTPSMILDYNANVDSQYTVPTDQDVASQLPFP